MNRSKYLGLLVALAAALPLTALAATSQTASMGTALVGGALSITAPAAGTFPSAQVSAGTVTSGVGFHSADWSDQTASGAGWNGTVQVQTFAIVPVWVVQSGASALPDKTSGQDTNTHSGAGGNGAYNVTVTTPPGGGSAGISWSGAETGSGTATCGTPFAVGTFGDTITFPVTCNITNGSQYTLKVGSMANTALALSGPATITTVNGSSPPVAAGGTSAITATSVTTFGSAVKFVTAAAGTGAGTYSITPSFNLTWTPTSTWALTYTSTAQYTITSGP